MTKFMTIDENGFPTAFFAEDVHGARAQPVYGPAPEPTEENPDPVAPVIGTEPNPNCIIPPGAAEISDEQWMGLLEHQGERKWVDGKVVECMPSTPAPTSADVDVERDRRTATLFAFNDVAYQLDADSQRFITAKGAQAKFAVLAGAQPSDLRWADPDKDFGWIATDNSVTPMDAQAMAAFADAADLWVTAHIMASHTLKAMDPIPADFADDQYWP